MRVVAHIITFNAADIMMERLGAKIVVPAP
jgi:hypothetical protein